MAQVVGGVQAPKYVYLPNATVRYNKLIDTNTFDTTPYATYTRPAEWLTLPEVNEGDEIVYLLVGLSENGSNEIKFQFKGDYTVDWGNGDILNYTNNELVTYYHQWDDSDDTTLTSDGYRQIIVKITPQTPGNFTQCYLNKEIGIIFDIKMAGQNIDSLKVKSLWLEHFEFVGSHSITNANQAFIGNSNLKKVTSLEMSGITDMSLMFYKCS